MTFTPFLLTAMLLPYGGAPQASGSLGALAQPQDGRSMRESSTFREGKDGRFDRNAPPKGDLLEQSNFDNFRVPPGATHVLMDAKGPGVITHIWRTFLGPEPQAWASVTAEPSALRCTAAPLHARKGRRCVARSPL